MLGMIRTFTWNETYNLCRRRCVSEWRERESQLLSRLT